MKNKKTKRVYYFTSDTEIILYLILYIIMQIICGYGMFKYYIMSDLKLSEKIITVAICIIHTNYMVITGVICNMNYYDIERDNLNENKKISYRS